MHRYVTMTPRQIYALAPMGTPRYAPDPLWFHAPHRVRAVAYRLGGTVADLHRANEAYAAGLRTLGTPGGALWAGLRGALAWGFRWDPQGPMTWPDIYVAVESFYRVHPELELWRSQALEVPQGNQVRMLRHDAPVPEPLTDFLPTDHHPG